MNRDELFNQYQSYILNLVSLTSGADASSRSVDDGERSEASGVEKEYTDRMSRLQAIKNAATKQYESVRETCMAILGLRRPVAQRSVYTTATVDECIKIQEQYAQRIQNLIAAVKQKAIEEKKKKQQEENAMRAIAEQRKAEEERRRQAAILEEEKRKKTAIAEENRRQGEQLLEEMKRKYKK